MSRTPSKKIIAGLLDSLTYGSAHCRPAGREHRQLAAYNNVQLFALMNSVGRRGAGYVGDGDVDGDAMLGPDWKRSTRIACAPASQATPGMRNFPPVEAAAARCWKRFWDAFPRARHWRLPALSEVIATIDEGGRADAAQSAARSRSTWDFRWRPPRQPASAWVTAPSADLIADRRSCAL
ncbi:MAG: hypothetical protein R2855_01530 [Thermomicrobiales bacterium]